jgi:phosphohistidine phosphatase SixA
MGKRLGLRVSVVDDLSPDRPLEDRSLEMMGHGEVKRMLIVGHVDNTTPAMRNLGGDQKWKDLVMAEIRSVKIDRGDGGWKLRWSLKPSDLGLKDHDA